MQLASKGRIFNLSFEWINSWLQEGACDFQLHMPGGEAVLHNEDEDQGETNCVTAITAK